MDYREYRSVVDKSGWGKGPWHDEPDKVQWQDEASGLPCLVVRGPSGAWCGYVGVLAGYLERIPQDDLRVHGGITYGAHCGEGPENASICHVPQAGEPDHVYWIGFDCGHSGDVCPAWRFRIALFEQYRDLAYVRSQVTSLAAQLSSYLGPDGGEGFPEAL